MTLNYGFCRLEEGVLRYAPVMVRHDGTVSVNPAGAVYAALGWYRLVKDPPAPGAGRVAVEDEPAAWAWEADGMLVRVTYREEDVPAPEPAPRRWTPLTLKRGAEARGWWVSLRSVLEAAGGYEDFLMCQFVAEDDAMFPPIYGALCDAFGKEQVDAYLDGLPTEA